METIRFTKNEAAARTIAAYYDTPPMLYVHSFGCQQNVNDGEKIKGVLTDIGFGLAARPEDAHLRGARARRAARVRQRRCA